MHAVPTNHPSTSLAKRIVLSLAIAVGALALHRVAHPIEAQPAFAAFYPGVVMAFYLTGFWPGMLTVVLSAAFALVLVTPGVGRDAMDLSVPMSVAMFIASSTLMGWVMQHLRDRIQNLETTNRMLSTSERRHQQTLDQQLDVICRIDAQGVLLYANPAFCQAFGKRLSELIGFHWSPVAVADDLPMVEAALARLTPTHPTVMVENRVIVHGGAIRWYQFVNQASYDDAGELINVLGVGRDVTRRKELEIELQKAHQELEDLYDHAPCGYHSIGSDGKYLRINQTELEWLGCTRDDVIGRLSPTDFFSANGRAVFARNFPNFLLSGRVDDMLVDLQGRDGRVRHVNLSATAVHDPEGRMLFSRSVMHDITDLHQARDQIRRLVREQQVMLDNDMIAIVKLVKRRAVWVNQGTSVIFGYPRDALVGQPSRLLYADDATHARIGDESVPVLLAGGIYRSQAQMRRQDGSTLWVEVCGTLVDAERGESMWLLVDISSSKQYQQHIEHIAFHDSLTGLPNRLLLADRMTQALAIAKRQRRHVAVAYLDLDGFKAVNDQHGHAAGDVVLKVVAERLRQSLRANDSVARLGGDEFVLLITDLGTRSGYHESVDRAMATIDLPIDLGEGVMAQVSASVGVAVYPEHGEQPQALLAHADAAMYVAKREGRSPVSSFAHQIDPSIQGN